MYTFKWSYCYVISAITRRKVRRYKSICEERASSYARISPYVVIFLSNEDDYLIYAPYGELYEHRKFPEGCKKAEDKKSFLETLIRLEFL